MSDSRIRKSRTVLHKVFPRISPERRDRVIAAMDAGDPLPLTMHERETLFVPPVSPSFERFLFPEGEATLTVRGRGNDPLASTSLAGWQRWDRTPPTPITADDAVESMREARERSPVPGIYAQVQANMSAEMSRNIDRIISETILGGVGTISRENVVSSRWSKEWWAERARGWWSQGEIVVESPQPGLVVIYLQMGGWQDDATIETAAGVHASMVERSIRKNIPALPFGLDFRVVASPCIEHRDRGQGDDPSDVCATNAVLGLACARGQR